MPSHQTNHQSKHSSTAASRSSPAHQWYYGTCTGTHCPATTSTGPLCRKPSRRNISATRSTVSRRPNFFFLRGPSPPPAHTAAEGLTSSSGLTNGKRLCGSVALFLQRTWQRCASLVADQPSMWPIAVIHLTSLSEIKPKWLPVYELLCLLLPTAVYEIYSCPCTL